VPNSRNFVLVVTGDDEAPHDVIPFLVWVALLLSGDVTAAAHTMIGCVTAYVEDLACACCIMFPITYYA